MEELTCCGWYLASAWTALMSNYFFRATGSFIYAFLLSAFASLLPFFLFAAFVADGWISDRGPLITFSAFNLAVILSAGTLAVLDRSDQRMAGTPHCDQCGYNLTGNVSGVCPECGTPVPERLQERPPQES